MNRINDTSGRREYLKLFHSPIYRRWPRVFLCCTTILREFQLKIRNWVLQLWRPPDKLPKKRNNFIYHCCASVLSFRSRTILMRSDLAKSTINTFGHVDIVTSSPSRSVGSLFRFDGDSLVEKIRIRETKL